MLRIAVCDDMPHDREAIIDHINRLTKQLTISVELFIYTDGEELLHEYPKELDLLFLDVQMAHTNGMKAAALLRQFDTSVTLIFMAFSVNGRSPMEACLLC